MLSVRFIVFKRYTYLIKIIVLFSKIMPFYSRYIKKKLLYIAITALSSCQPSFHFKCTKLNIYLFCDI